MDRLDNHTDINYILQGHAAHHLGYAKWFGKLLVFGWKLGYHGHLPSEATLWWWDKGYDEYSLRQWYYDADEMLDDILP